jgi:hypothetical protein
VKHNTGECLGVQKETCRGEMVRHVTAVLRVYAARLVGSESMTQEDCETFISSLTSVADPVLVLDVATG